MMPFQVARSEFQEAVRTQLSGLDARLTAGPILRQTVPFGSPDADAFLQILKSALRKRFLRAMPITSVFGLSLRSLPRS